MFPARKRIVLLHLSGQVIRTTADQPFYVMGQGWVNAAEMPGVVFAEMLATPKRETGAVIRAFQAGKGSVSGQPALSLQGPEPPRSCCPLWDAACTAVTLEP
jgi:hypothetical protein